MKAPQQAPVTRDVAEKAAELFGLQLDTLTEIGLTKAFRFAIRAAHPDTGAKPEEAAELIQTARGARTVLLRWLAEQPDDDCPQCDGSGWVNAGMRVRPCTNPKCGGRA